MLYIYPVLRISGAKGFKFTFPDAKKQPNYEKMSD